jgi:dTDP-glucose 4,6-dehydratase
MPDLHDRHLLADDLDSILDQTRDLWAGLQGKRIFLTGGTGFFGCWLLESLIRASEKLGVSVGATVLTRNPDAFRSRVPHLAANPAIRFHAGDVRNFEFPREEFSHVIHAATPVESAVILRDSPAALEMICQGTRRALEFARQCGAKRFLLTSSGAVYGRQPENTPFLDEDFTGAPNPLHPDSVYAEGKRVSERYCAEYQSNFGIETLIARCFAFIGPYQSLDAGFAITDFIRNGLEGAPIQVNGDGTAHRSYLHASDLTTWLWTILAKGKPGRAYNVGSDQPLSIAEVAREVAAAFGVDFKIAKKPVSGGPQERYIPSVQRAKAELGLKQSLGFKESLSRTVKWYRNPGRN